MLKKEDLGKLREARRRFLEHELRFPNPDSLITAEIMRNFAIEEERLIKLRKKN